MDCPCWIEIPARDVAKLKVRMEASLFEAILVTKLKHEIELLYQSISILGMATSDR
jgi:hypothetical protein